MSRTTHDTTGTAQLQRRLRRPARLALLGALAFAVGISGQGPAGQAVHGARAHSRCPAVSVTQSATVSASKPDCHSPGTRPSGPGRAPDVAVRHASPYLGEPCRNVYYYAVTLVTDAQGRIDATFAFAGGATAGTLPLSPWEQQLAATHDAYVTDIQLGSYEPTDPAGPEGRLVCQVNPTYHFYCPATGAVDMLCFTWVYRRSRAVKGDVAMT